jgi:hypothetical protein
LYFLNADRDSTVEGNRFDMKAHIIAMLIAITLSFATSAMAVSATGTMTVTGTLAGAINVTFDSAPGTVTGIATSAITSDLGTFTRWSTVPTNFSFSSTSTNWTLTGNLYITVDKANLTSANFTLTAQLNSTPATGVTWKMVSGTYALSSGAATTLSSTASYASSTNWTPSITFTNTAAPGSIGNTVTFTATAN